MQTHIRNMTAAAAVMMTAAALADPGTAFTYQGQLKNGGVLATGPHDLRFRLFDAATGGNQVGSTLCADDAAVAEGLFTVILDFGGVFAAGDPLFLEIDVRQDTGLNCSNAGGFVSMSSRQALTPAPFAAYATNARSAISAESADNANTLGGQASTFYRNATNLNAGTLADARLTANVPRLNAASTFTGAVTMTNAANQFAGSGTGLVGLNATNLTTGTVADALLSSNIARLNGVNLFTNAGNVFVGDGSGLTGLSASGLSGQIVGTQIADNSIDTFKIAPSAIIGSDISDNSIGSTKIVNGAVTSLKLAAGSVSGGVGGTIADGSIGNADLQANMIASVNIIDGTIVAADIAGGAVTGALIADDSITAPDLAPGSVGASEIADGSVGSAEITTNAVTSAKLAVDAVTNTRLALDSASLLRVTGGAMQSNGTRIGLGAAPLATHELYVNGDLRAETGIDTPGTVTANAFVYSPPAMRYYSINGFDMFPGNTSELTNGDIYILPTVAAKTYLVSVHLPHGATVTALRVNCTDDNSLNDVTAFLLRRGNDGSAGGTLAQLSTSGNVPGIREFTDTSISGAVIDNDTFYYVFRLDMPGTSLGGIAFRAARIEYTLSQP